MNFGDRYFEQKIQQWAKAKISERSLELMNGMADDHANYRERVGYIAALQDLLAEMQVTEREMTARPETQERA